MEGSAPASLLAVMTEETALADHIQEVQTRIADLKLTIEVLGKEAANQQELEESLQSRVLSNRDALDELFEEERKLGDELATLQARINIYRGSVGDKVFHLEVMLHRTKPWYWIIMIAITAVCLMGNISSGRWMLVPINWLAFLCVWRTLYVANNGAALLFAILVSVASVYYWTN